MGEIKVKLSKQDYQRILLREYLLSRVRYGCEVMDQKE